jgi:hypothetical protein
LLVALCRANALDGGFRDISHEKTGLHGRHRPGQARLLAVTGAYPPRSFGFQQKEKKKAFQHEPVANLRVNDS